MYSVNVSICKTSKVTLIIISDHSEIECQLIAERLWKQGKGIIELLDMT